MSWLPWDVQIVSLFLYAAAAGLVHAAMITISAMNPRYERDVYILLSRQMDTAMALV
jgi:hypothetical protein